MTTSGTGGIIWIASYPKSGNTWLRIFLVNLMTDASSPVDINRLDGIPHAATRHLFDSVTGVSSSDLTPKEVDGLRGAAYGAMAFASQAPLFMKIHDAFRCTSSGQPLIPGQVTEGVIYLVRNPLDLASSYAFHRGTTIDEVIEVMGDSDHALSRPEGGIDHQLPQHLGSWSQHVESWMDAPGLRIQVVRYEDLAARPQEVFGSVATFAGVPHTPESLSRAIGHSTFEEVSRQEADSGYREGSMKAPFFFRSGKVGGWREELSEDQVDRIILDHGQVMRRLAYLSPGGEPVQ